MTRQYVSVKFREQDQRTYTYHNDGEPLAPGDTGKVDDPRGGWKRVYVVAVSDQAPTFATKPVEKFVPPPAADPGGAE